MSGLQATEAAIGLGSNLGDRRSRLDFAVRELAAAGQVVAVSSLYETAPIGGPAQGAYLNAVAVVDTLAEPRPLLDLLLAIEARAGRTRRRRWAARSLDLDLLLLGDREVDEPGLRVPHSRLTERRFVLEPLLEVRPGAALPGGAPLAPYLAAVVDQDAAVVAGQEWASDAAT